MSEEDRGFKVTDRRGQPKEDRKAEPETETEKPKQEEPKKETDQKEAPGEARPVDFQALCFSLTTSAMMCMGVIENPQTKKKEKDLTMAKQQIDILEMLQTKTKGNLTENEEKFLTDALYQLRMVFVEASK